MQGRIEKPVFHTGMTRVYPHTYYTKTMGADPEFFVEDPNGGIIPAFTFLRSQKELLDIAKLINSDLTAYHKLIKADPSFAQTNSIRNLAGGFTYWDGYQAEFSTSNWTCNDGGCNHLQQGLSDIIHRLHHKGLVGKLSNQTAPYIPIATRKKAAEEHNALGCKPSFNAYDRMGMPVDEPAKLKYRFAGGHIHLGGYAFANNLNWKGAHKFAECQLDPKAFWSPTVKSLDKILGIWSVCAFADYDKVVRRQYYGLPGEFRAPKHGLEYRTLSNAWLMFGPSIAYLTMGIAREVVALHDEDALKFWIADEQEVFDAIVNNDVKAARKILKENKAMFEWLVPMGVAGACPVVGGIEAYNVAMQGIGHFMKEPMDVQANWAINKEGLIQWTATSSLQWGRTCQMLTDGKKIPTLMSYAQNR